uniref:GH18 domain-containing protein n=1 Tax=Stomoxys calcitrans TaxID=35570 RepID=A0A1I8Q3S3_STOCA
MFKFLFFLTIFTLCDILQAVETDKMINCYYGSWNHNDQFRKHLEPKDINPYLCTHISYGFFGISSVGAFTVLNVNRDLNLGYLDHTLALKWRNPELKMIAVVGGPSVSSKLFSRVAAMPELRSTFRHTTLAFLQAHGFDGLDLHWLYPGSEGMSGDFGYFVTLLKELKEALSPLKMELGISVSGKVSIARNWYDIPNIVKYVDFINVMAYNYTSGNRLTHDAPLFGRGDDNVEATINFWIDKGAPSSKLNLGVAFVAHSYILWDSQDIRTETAVDTEWPFSSVEPEFKPYGQICHIEYMKLIFNTSYGFDGEVGASFVQDQVTWTSYESPRSLEMKMDFVLQERLRGVMIWSLQNDDYLGKCFEDYAMLQVINRKLDNRFQCQPNICCIKSIKLRNFCFKIESEGQFHTCSVEKNSSSYSKMNQLIFLLITLALCGLSETVITNKMINCYYGVWSFKRPTGARLGPVDIDPYLCTHISYAYFGISDEGLFTALQPKRGLLNRTINLKWRNPELKLIAVFGGPEVDLQHFLKMKSYDCRKFLIFRDSMSSFLLENGFDGVDLHWLLEKSGNELPQKNEFTDMLRGFKQGLAGIGLTVGVTVSGEISYARMAYDVKAIAKIADYINIRSYNYSHDTWATHDAPLWGTDEYNVDRTIQYWLENGAPASKLNVGVAFTGRSFQIKPLKHLETKTVAVGPGISGLYTREKNYMSYHELCKIQKRLKRLQPKALGFDTIDGASFMQFRDYWWSYENAQSLELKLDYLLEHQLGGIMIWSLGNDDFNGRCGPNFPLLQFIVRKLDDRYECLRGRCCIITKNLVQLCFEAY